MAKLSCFVLALLGAQVIGLKIANDKSSGELDWNTVEAAKFVERKLKRPPDECLCKPWSQVYRLVPGMCGNGGEFASVMAKNKVSDLELAKKIWNETLCNNFFRLLDTDECVLHHGDDEKGTYQWCYTDPWCVAPDMNMKRPTSRVVGKKGGRHFLAKKCSAGVDRLLSDRTPEQLVNLRAQYGDTFKLHVLLSFAYPLTRFNPSQMELEDFKRIVNMRAEDVHDKVAAKAYSLVDPNMPMMASVSDKEALIILGKTLYKVENSKEKLECLMNCPGTDKYVWNPKAAREFRILDQRRASDMDNVDKAIDAELQRFPVPQIQERYEKAFEETEKQVAQAEEKAATTAGTTSGVM